jgi:hypothetical protein
MIKYRFVTPHRIGKWYGSLREAQRYACRIGAGFLHEASQRFIAYPGTRLEQLGQEIGAVGRRAGGAVHAAMQKETCAIAKSAHHGGRFDERANPFGAACP